MALGRQEQKAVSLVKRLHVRILRISDDRNGGHLPRGSQCASKRVEKQEPSEPPTMVVSVDGKSADQRGWV